MKQKYIVFGFLCATYLSSLAQITNLGELRVLPDTQVALLHHFDNKASGEVLNDGQLLVYQNFNNDGVFSFSSGSTTGTLSFQGTAEQQITGGQRTELYEVSFDNSSATQPAFLLEGDLHILNKAVFTQGILKNRGLEGTISFEKEAVPTDVSDASHVDGKVVKIGDQVFTYPLGNNDYYREIAISAPLEETDAYSSQYFLENSDVSYPHSSAASEIAFIDDSEYWTLTREEGTSTVLVTLSWNENTTSSQTLEEPQKLQVVRWDTTEDSWVVEGGTVDEANKTVTTVLEKASGYGVFALAKIEEGDNCVVYNAITNNGDGKNSYLKIDCVDRYPDNNVKIFNKVGMKVFEIQGYNNTTRIFEGFSNRRGTINSGERLPTGTYYYIINYQRGSQVVKKAGYIEIVN